MAKENMKSSSEKHLLQNAPKEVKIKETEAYSHTIFDDVLRTMEEKAEMLFIPAINEFFHKSYPEDEEILHLRNEHQKPEGRVITDTCLLIKGIRYHIECQSYPDGTMVVRMFEYDVLIALEQAEKTEDGYKMQFPHSCVIYLRHTKNTEEELYMTVEFPYGEKVRYRVPVVKAQEYTMNEIFKKKLYFLLPYYIIRYEKELDEVEKSKEKRQNLIDEYDEICQRLREELADGHPDIYNKVLELMKKVVDYMLRNKQMTKKGMGDLMGGKVLELETDRYDEAIKCAKILGLEMGRRDGEKMGKKIGEKIGREKGEKIGREKGEKIGREKGEKIGREKGEKIGKEIGKEIGRADLVSNMLSNGISPEEISRMCNLSLEEVLKIKKSRYETI